MSAAAIIRTAANAVTLDGVRVRYGRGGAVALDIDRLTIGEGERVALIGPSGAGKTTLVRLINGLVAPSEGTVRVLGEELTPRTKRRREFRRRVGCVFQEFNLVERESVFRNVLCGRLGWVRPMPSLLGWFSDTDRAMAMQAIEETGLGALRDRRVDSLSGGQRQRVAIARALAQDPDLLTADEPVSNLDPVLTADMLDLIAAGATRHHATLVMIVHHPALAQGRADRVLGLRDGRVVYDSHTGAPLDARAQRELYGRNLPLTPVEGETGPGDRDADDGLSPLHVA